ncbi:MAG: WYL domain-containing protein [Phycisphaera sp.]|nr:WYL domain-containing protein [Phycisphaera sp.]
MNVSRLHRVIRLITILQSGAPMTSAMLAEELGVSRRTLFRDLETIEAAGIPCYHDAERGEYRIASSFFLPPVNLKVTEAMGLMMLAKAAEERRGEPLLDPAVEAVRKLISMMPNAIRDVCGEMMGNVTVRQAPSAIPQRDPDHYATLQRAIDERRVVAMKYYSLFDRSEIDVSLRPYHLHYAVRAWYVIGHSESEDDLRIYKLSRIRGLTPTDRTFRLAKPFDIAAYLGKAWQMIPEGKVYKVELEFARKVATNVSDVRWHHTQQHRMLDDGRCVMTFEVDGLNEITWWLLGYGDQVIVRKPAALRDRLLDVYRNALKRYEEA